MAVPLVPVPARTSAWIRSGEKSPRNRYDVALENLQCDTPIRARTQQNANHMWQTVFLVRTVLTLLFRLFCSEFCLRAVAVLLLLRFVCVCVSVSAHYRLTE